MDKKRKWKENNLKKSTFSYLMLLKSIVIIENSQM